MYDKILMCMLAASTIFCLVSDDDLRQSVKLMSAYVPSLSYTPDESSVGISARWESEFSFFINYVIMYMSCMMPVLLDSLYALCSLL